MIRLGISSAGGFVERGVLPRLVDVENIELAGISDEVAPDRAKLLAEKFNIKKVYPKFEDILADDSIDAVYICSPNLFHVPMTIAAAKAGKHVVSEKPLGLTADDARKAVEACEENNVKLAVDFCYPHAGPQTKAKELLDNGVIGELSHINVSFNLFNLTKKTGGWRCDPKISGGGALMDLAPHLVNLACFFADDTVESVMAYVEPDKTETDVEGNTVAAMRMKNGVTVAMEVSFNRCMPNNYRVMGTKGSIDVTGGMNWQVGGKVVLITLTDDFNTEEIEYEKIEPIEQAFRVFANAVENDKELFSSGQAGLHAQAVIDAIFESARTGKRCSVK